MGNIFTCEELFLFYDAKINENLRIEGGREGKATSCHVVITAAGYLLTLKNINNPRTLCLEFTIFARRSQRKGKQK